MPQPIKDIEGLDDIRLLVNDFYARARKDDLLGNIFNDVIGDRWDNHLEKMYRFWQTVLLSEHTYYGSPFPPHSKLPLENQHFDRWLLLFRATITENFAGPKADEALWRAARMAEMFSYKMQHMKQAGLTL